jgi:hypothetical protein
MDLHKRGVALEESFAWLAADLLSLAKGRQRVTLGGLVAMNTSALIKRPSQSDQQYDLRMLFLLLIVLCLVRLRTLGLRALLLRFLLHWLVKFLL